MFAAPRGDDPGTAFNESDAPVSQISSVVPHIALASLSEGLLTPPASLWFEYKLRLDVPAVATTHIQAKPDSLAIFLCTFVC